MTGRSGLTEVLELATSAAVVAGALQLTTQAAHALDRKPDAVRENPSGTRLLIDHGLFQDFVVGKAYPSQKKSRWSIFTLSGLGFALARVYIAPVNQLLQEHFSEMERRADEAEEGQEPDMPPFPFERLQEIVSNGLPTAGVEAAKTVLLSLVKWTLDGLAIDRCSDRWGWALTKDVRKSIIRKGKRKGMRWFQRAWRAPATYCRTSATLCISSLLVSLPFEARRVIKQSRREKWPLQKTTGILGRVVLARLVVQEIGLLAGCAGVCIGAAVWPSAATWFATVLELPTVILLAPEVDKFFSIIIDPPPLGPDGTFPGQSRTSGSAPGQLTQDVYAPQQAEAEADAVSPASSNDSPSHEPPNQIAAAPTQETSAQGNANAVPDHDGNSDDDSD